MQNFIKTILSAFQLWIRKQIKNSKADWNQNDPNADDYVKNRTHWEEETQKYLLDEKEYDFPEHFTMTNSDAGKTYELCRTNWKSIKINSSVEKDKEYYILFDGKEYKLKCEETEGSLYLGWDYYGAPNDEHDFGICYDMYGSTLMCIFTKSSNVNKHTVAIYTNEMAVHKLDSKYLDLPKNVATTDDVQMAIDVANTAQTTANTAVANADTAQATADTKMDAVNPAGTGNFSINRQPESDIGDYSVAIGQNTIAQHAVQHVIGQYNDAATNYIVYYFKNVNATVLNSTYYYSQEYKFDNIMSLLLFLLPLEIMIYL